MASIVAATTDEFNQLGYAHATRSNIARKAGVTETQLFRYFGSKPALFRETIFEPLSKHPAELIKQFLPGSELEVKYTTELQRFIREHKKLFISLTFA